MSLNLYYLRPARQIDELSHRLPLVRIDVFSFRLIPFEVSILVSTSASTIQPCSLASLAIQADDP